MMLYSIFSILVAIVLIYSSIGMYKDKLIKSAITTDVLSLILIGLAVCGFIISEDYHKYIIFSMLGIVISLVLVYYLSNKKNPKKTK